MESTDGKQQRGDSGNFANDREKASETHQKVNFANGNEEASEAGRNGGQH